MTQQVTLNGTLYSDDGSVGKGMADGGFHENLLPMLSDCIVDISQTKEEAEHQADLAEASAVAAALAAATVVTGPGSNGSSTTSLTIGLGVQSLVIQTGKTIPVGAPVMIASTASPDNWMHGTAISYTSGTGALQVNVKNIGLVTPGTYPTLAAWTVSLSGPAGVTGVLNELKSASVASAATVNLDATTGNFVHLTGSTTITAITLAQGAARTVIVDAAPLLTHGANLVLPGLENIQAGAGDTFTIRGDGGGKSVVVHYTRAARALPTGAFRNAEVLTSSQVWTAKVTGVHRLILVGASGSGGVAWSVVSGALTASAAAASGGSTGGIVIKYFYAVAGDSYVLSLGAAGVSVTCTSGNAVQGNDAVDSTFTGPGVSVTAGGGKKGAAAIASSGTAVAAGAPGGTASGGDFNIAGGASGTATATADPAGNAAATGGGAAPYKGVGYASGAATANRAGAAAAASGGAAVGGGSGSATATTTNASSGGAGSGGPSANATNTAVGAGGVGVPAAFASVLVTTPLTLSGVGGNGSTTTAGSSGAASAGNTSSNTGAAALLAGSGGAARTVSSSGTTVTSGAVALGGASGGVAVAANTNAAGTATSGDAGAAFAIIETT